MFFHNENIINELLIIEYFLSNIIGKKVFFKVKQLINVPTIRQIAIL